MAGQNGSETGRQWAERERAGIFLTVEWFKGK